MDVVGKLRETSVAPPGPGRFRPVQGLAWLVACLLLGMAAAASAQAVQRTFAPLGLFPLLAGVVLGGLLVVLMRAGHVGHRPTLVAGAALAVGVTVVGQHFLSYREAVRAATAGRAPWVAALFPEHAPPQSFAQYLREEARHGRPVGRLIASGPWVWLTWGLDALLLAIPAMLLVVVSARLPYCDRCGTWYRTIRAARLESPSAMELAALVGLPCPATPYRLRVRMIDCAGGCGPAGLACAWSDLPPGTPQASTPGYLWLDRAARAQIQAILDRLAEEVSPPPADPKAQDSLLRRDRE